jgi:hypothetical protein
MDIPFLRNIRSSKKKTIEPLPTDVMDHHKLVNHSYTIAQLKTIAKSFSIKVSQFYSHLWVSHVSSKTDEQRIVR